MGWNGVYVCAGCNFDGIKSHCLSIGNKWIVCVIIFAYTCMKLIQFLFCGAVQYVLLFVVYVTGTSSIISAQQHQQKLSLAYKPYYVV